MPDTLDLYTTVKNVSGAPKTFGYLPPHGKLLQAGQQFTLFGDLMDVISIPPRGSPRKKAALERDLLSSPPRLVILKTPQAILLDASPAAALADPAGGALVVNPTGGGAVGGSLPAGSYRVALTFVQADGSETTIGNTESAVFVVAAGNIPRITLPALPAGAVAFNIYATVDLLGTSGTELLYATGVTGATYDMVTAPPSFAAPASSNTAGLPNPTRTPVVDPDSGGSTGGRLQAGTYFGKYTWTTALGETQASPESVQFTVAAGSIPQMDIGPLPDGATGANIYLTAAGGPSGTETLYKTATGGSLVSLDTATFAGGAAPPSVNTALFSPPSNAPFGDVFSAGQIVSGAPLASRGLDFQIDFLQPPTTGGNLSPGTYYARYAYVSRNGGVTTPSPSSLPFTITQPGQIAVLQLLFDDQKMPPGIDHINLYVTAPNGAPGSERLVMTNIRTPVVLLVIPTEGKKIPQTNTTGGSITKVAAVSNNTLGTADPSWGAYKGPV